MSDDDKLVDAMVNAETSGPRLAMVQVERGALEDMLRENRELSEHCEQLQRRMSEMASERQALGGLQEWVAGWLKLTLGVESLDNLRERAFRFIEEAMELAQACGVTRDEAQKLHSAVYEQRSGQFRKELGDAHLTLLALADTLRIDLLDCTKQRLEQLSDLKEIERVRAHHLDKRDKGLTSD